MLARIKEKYIEHFVDQVRFNGFIKVIKKKRNGTRVKLENGNWYEYTSLEFKKESGGSRYRKPKQEVIKIEEDKKEIEIDIGRLNMELKVGEYEEIIKMKEKECDSWMKDFNEAKKEKIEYEHKYDEVSNKNNSLSKRISLLVELQEQLRSKKDMWKELFLINIIIDVIYIIIKSSGIL